MASLCVVNLIILFNYNQRTKARQVEGDDLNETMGDTKRKREEGVKDFSKQKCQVQHHLCYSKSIRGEGIDLWTTNITCSTFMYS